MANIDKAQTATAIAQVLDGGGGSLALDSLQITCNLNSWPTASMTVHRPDAPAEQSAVNVLSEDLIAIIARDQNAQFQNVITPNMQVLLTDGAGDTLTLRGFRAMPGYEYKQGSIGLQRTLLHEGSILSLLKTNIYNPAPKTETELKKAKAGSFAIDHRDPRVKITGSVARRYYDIASFYTRLWRQNRVGQTTNTLNILADEVAAVNQQIFPVLERILQNSFGTTDWINSFQDLPVPAISDQINDVLADIYLKSDGDFMQQLVAINANFPGFFAPSLVPGQYGTLYRTADLMSDELEPINLLLREIRFNTQGFRNLPSTQVIVRGTPQIEFRSGPGGQPVYTPLKPPVVVTWPVERPPAGIGVDATLPAWLNGSVDQFPLRMESNLELLDPGLYTRSKAKAQSYGARVTNPLINNLLRDCLLYTSPSPRDS